MIGDWVSHEAAAPKAFAAECDDQLCVSSSVGNSVGNSISGAATSENDSEFGKLL